MNLFFRYQLTFEFERYAIRQNKIVLKASPKLNISLAVFFKSVKLKLIQNYTNQARFAELYYP